MSFSQLPAVKNMHFWWATQKYFGPFYFVLALVSAVFLIEIQIDSTSRIVSAYFKWILDT
jgi:hypothetical protein